MMTSEKGQAVYSFLGYAILVLVVVGVFFLFPWSDTMEHKKDPGLQEAYKAISQKQWNKALGLFNKAIGSNPKSAAAYLGRARANAELGHLDKALDDVNQALNFDPKNAGSLAQRAVIFKMQGKLNEANDDLTTAIRLNGRDAWIIAQRADVLIKKGNAEEALKEINKALKLDKNSVGAYRLRALILTNLGKCKDAFEDFKKVEVLGATDAVSLQDKAWFLLTCPDETMKDPDKAMALAQKAFDLSGGKSGLVLETMAEANFRKGDALKAVELQKKAIELETKKCPDGACVAEMKERLKKYEMASRQEFRPRQEILPLGPAQ
ncbi:MAG: tetratricopeptide repeat protein [Thermodesulfobacteriota bacterium]